jgi:hypothetical protein
MRTNAITTSSQLRQALIALAACETVRVQRDKILQMRAAVALYAPKLSVEEKATMHSAVVSQVAKEFGLQAHPSKRVSPMGFYPMTFSETSNAGKAANMAVARATAPMRFTDADKAKAYADKMLAPRVTKVASSADRVSAVVKAYTKLTVSQQRKVWEALKAL